VGLLTKFSSIFGAKPASKPAPGEHHRSVPPVPSRPVDIDLSRDDEDDLLLRDEHDDARRTTTLAPTPPAPKSKAELLSELQKNYAEVMELIRKVSTHLDEQSERSERLLAIAERIPEAIDALPELRTQNAEILVALRDAAEAARARDERAATTLDRLGDRLEEARESDRVLVGTMAEFRGTLREMADSSERTGATLSEMNQRNAAREQELTNILQLTRRWITIATVVGVVLVMVATAAIIIMVARG